MFQSVTFCRSEEKLLSFPNRSQPYMYDLLITSPDAQPLNYARPVGAKATFEPPLSLTKNSHLYNRKTTFMYYSRTSM